MTPTQIFDQARAWESSPSGVPPVNPPALRLFLDPALCGDGGVSGVWWPCSDNAGEQLSILIAELDHRLGTTVLTVALHPGTWADTPSRIPARGRLVEVDWAGPAGFHVIGLHTANGGADLKLLVIPAGTGGTEATVDLLLATKRWNRIRSAEIMNEVIIHDSISALLPRNRRTSNANDDDGSSAGIPRPRVLRAGPAPTR